MKFKINHPGEEAAGINPYSNAVTIETEYDPGEGRDETFEQFMLGCLSDWFDGADVVLDERKFGCHCDLDPGMEPDACVLDEGRPDDCIYAARLKRKEDCEYWREI